MRGICELTGIDKLRTTVYKPSTNAAVEGFRRTLNAMLVKVVETCQRDWDQRLSYVMAAYRSSRHDSTGFSPNFLVLGREVRMHIDLILGRPENETPRSSEDFVEQVQRRYLESYALVRDELGRNALRQKRAYDMRVRPIKFTVGTWVWAYSPRRYVGRSSKWQKNYSGPFLVIKVLGPVNVILRKSRRARSIVIHVDKLKPFYGDPPPSWLPASATTEGIPSCLPI